MLLGDTARGDVGGLAGSRPRSPPGIGNPGRTTTDPLGGSCNRAVGGSSPPPAPSQHAHMSMSVVAVVVVNDVIRAISISDTLAESVRIFLLKGSSGDLITSSED